MGVQLKSERVLDVSSFIDDPRTECTSLAICELSSDRALSTPIGIVRLGAFASRGKPSGGVLPARLRRRVVRDEAAEVLCV